MYFEHKNKLRSEDGKVHIFDISDCLRKSLILKQNQDKITYSIYDLLNFIQGLNSETTLVEILSKTTDLGTDYQKDVVFEGISAHPDYIEGDVVFELKSTNKIKPLILSDDTVKGYIRQVVYYMVLLNLEKGRILVRYNLPYFPEFTAKEIDESTNVEENLYKLIFHKDSGQFPFFAIKLTIPLDDPIREIIKKGLKDIVIPAYEAGKPEDIPRLDGAKDGSNWKCVNYCKVRDICLQLPDSQTDFEHRYVLLNKHLDNATNRIRYTGRKNKPVDIS